MKKIILGLVLSSLVYSPCLSFAEMEYQPEGGNGRFYPHRAENIFPGISLDARIGGSTVDFQELKNAMDDITDFEAGKFAQNFGGSGQTTFAEVTGGLEAMVSLFANLTPNFALGVKGIYIEPGKMNTHITADGDNFETLDYDFNMSSSLAATLVGVQFKSPRTRRGVSWALSFMAGPAFANATSELHEFINQPLVPSTASLDYSIPLSGSGVYAEATVSSEYLMTENFGFTAGLGFHYCAIGQMKSVAGDLPNNVGLYQNFTGNTFQDISGRDVIFNFAGFDFNVGANFYF